MGISVDPTTFSRQDHRRYRRKVRLCLDVFAQMLDHFVFDEQRPMTGLEIEINLIDAAGDPAMVNSQVLAALSDPDFQTELGRFNLELNVPPRLLTGTGLSAYERSLREKLNFAESVAAQIGAGLVLVGILPTVTPEHAVVANISENPRYRTLNDQILNSHVDDIVIDIHGIERLHVATESILPEAANTSVQYHLQVTPATFAAYWNASQAIACAQVAVGANSPFLFGKRLWDETRIALFEQAADTRPAELKIQGVRPRVWFGERWITSIFDLFEENVRYFPVLLPVCDDEDPTDVIAAGGVPKLAELRLHNGTVYRWNRPVYDIMDGVPHLRVENRVLPAGPTVIDMMANAAFFFGLVRTFAEADRPIWSQLPFAAAEQNFFVACREGLNATVFWPRGGEIRVVDLILERLLPAAYEGLAAYGVDSAEADRYLSVIEGRCIQARTGAAWQTHRVARLEAAGMDRTSALHQMLRDYVALMHSNEPVHTWPT